MRTTSWRLSIVRAATAALSLTWACGAQVGEPAEREEVEERALGLLGGDNDGNKAVLPFAPSSSAYRAAKYAINILKVYPSKRVGGVEQPATPVVGGPYRLTVEWEVTGKPAAPYPVYFELAAHTATQTVWDLSPGIKQASWEATLNLDDPIPFHVEVDPFNQSSPDYQSTCSSVSLPGLEGSLPAACVISGKRESNGTFTPTAPAAGIDNFAPRTLIGYQTQVLTFTPGVLSSLTLMMGQPSSDGWQKFLSGSATVKTSAGTFNVPATAVDNPTLYPVYLWKGSSVPNAEVTMTQSFGVQLSNQRVNPGLLRSVTWAELDALSGIDSFQFQRQAETVVEVNDPKIAQFVSQTLGANYRSTTTPYDAARTLFKAVLKHVSYTYPGAGEADLRGHTAVQVIDKKLADCGGFSLLLVALFRKIGLPARVACGMWEGGAGHCWAELWFPRYGWMVADGSGGNGASSDGQFAYNFGVNLDLNARMAFMRGNTFNVGSVSSAWLQGPMWPVVQGTASIKSATSKAGMGTFSF